MSRIDDGSSASEFEEDDLEEEVASFASSSAMPAHTPMQMSEVMSNARSEYSGFGASTSTTKKRARSPMASSQLMSQAASPHDQYTLDTLNDLSIRISSSSSNNAHAANGPLQKRPARNTIIRELQKENDSDTARDNEFVDHGVNASLQAAQDAVHFVEEMSQLLAPLTEAENTETYARLCTEFVSQSVVSFMTQARQQVTGLTLDNVNMTLDDIGKRLINAISTITLCTEMEQDDKNQPRVNAVQCMSVVSNAFKPVISFIESKQRDFTPSARLMLNMFQASSEEFKDEPFLRLQIVISQALTQRRYKRGVIPGRLYQQIMTPTGHPTRFWKGVKELSVFINELTQNRLDPDSWKTLNRSANMRYLLVKHFAECDDLSLSTATPARGIYSFTNGIYDSNKNTFALYGTPLFYEQYPDDVCAYNYFPFAAFNPDGFDPITGAYNWDEYGIKFDRDWKFKPELAPAKHWTNMTVQFLQVFMDAQQWPWEVQLVFAYALGRCQHPIEDDEQWAVNVAGASGVGKSTALSYLLQCYPFEYRGLLMSNGEDTFALQDFMSETGQMTKHIAYVSDMNDKLNLSFATLNQMVSAENVGTGRKNKSAGICERWDTPLYFNMNGAFFQCEIAQRETLMRRWPRFYAHTRPVGPAPSLPLYRQNMGEFIKYTNLAMHEWRRRLHLMDEAGVDVPSNIWDHLPPYFTEQWNAILTQTSAIARFLLNSDCIRPSTNSSAKLSLESISNAQRMWAIRKTHSQKASMITPNTMSQWIQLCFKGKCRVQVGNFVDHFSAIPYNNESYITGYELVPTPWQEDLLSACRSGTSGGGSDVTGVRPFNSDSNVPAASPFHDRASSSRVGNGFNASSANGRASANDTARGAQPYSSYTDDNEYRAPPAKRQKAKSGVALPSIAMEFMEEDE